ncbi:MAG: hypothetical protein ACTHVY_12280 [Brevibacterium yomogidense]|uniref:hypothetical protein n=1 Tax=Brevibacterium sp. Mu109 TaxID=1255669 RepID=UPI000C3E8F92|nr:hypothetical protein [Brevibacterium sp. Mu109]SMX71842.1 hypothetical protein BSP109_00851 [Brevibacterium sp. Mu109]
MQRYRHVLGHGRSCTAEDPPADLYGLPALPPDEPMPKPAPARSGPGQPGSAQSSPAQSSPRRSRVRPVFVWLGLAAGVVATAASAAAFFSAF